MRSFLNPLGLVVIFGGLFFFFFFLGWGGVFGSHLDFCLFCFFNEFEFDFCLVGGCFLSLSFLLEAHHLSLKTCLYLKRGKTQTKQKNTPSL